MNVHLRVLPKTHTPTDGVSVHLDRDEAASETVILEPLTDEEKKSASKYLHQIAASLPEEERLFAPEAYRAAS
jgi:hypothetical protein